MNNSRTLPDGPLIAFLGDDLTGSCAVMEATALAGLSTVLFLTPPSPARLAAFADRRVIGIAGLARTKTPAWMDEHLPPIYDLLAATGAPLLHYKVCSTLDSAPDIGSIGRAADRAAERFGGWIPVVVADPALGRYQAFGNLFAAVDGTVWRLDRHPVMARHPVTPMDEADVLRHLARQTRLPIRLIDLAALKGGRGGERLAAVLADGARLVAIDVIDDDTLAEAGRLMWEGACDQLFVVGSQGVEAALVAHWRRCAMLAPPPIFTPTAPVERLAVVSGSVSPITARQIAVARAHGFATIPLDAACAVDPDAWRAETGRASVAALAAMSEGRDVIVHSAAGPEDPAVAALRTAIATSGLDGEIVNERIGVGLGTVLDAILDATRLSRVVIAGGDTSGRAAITLGVDALSVASPFVQGSPLCLSASSRADRNGLELLLKGGQIGSADYFTAAKSGGHC